MNKKSKTRKLNLDKLILFTLPNKGFFLNSSYITVKNKTINKPKKLFQADRDDNSYCLPSSVFTINICKWL